MTFPLATRRRAFTLIELLTVIAIMSILASMIMPSLSRAREMGRRTACLSNMKQLGLGFRQYVDDYDGRYPYAGNFQKWGDGGHWVKGKDNENVAGLVSPYAFISGRRVDVEGGAIFPYIKNAQVYICPSSNDGRDKNLDYSMNCVISGQSELSAQDDTSIVLLVDEDKPSDGYFWASGGTAAGSSSDHMTQIHNGGGNLLFCDGHAKFYPYKVFPIGDNTDGTSGADSAFMKTRRTGQPRFFDNAGTPDCTF